MIMKRKKYCIFACGGHGTRMGGETPKQFLRIGEKTVLQLSIEKICDVVPDVRVIVVLPQEWIEFWKEECHKGMEDVHQTLVQGGITRFHSVKNALTHVPDGAIVAVHDGVRPLVSQELVRSLFENMEAHQAVVPVIPVTDTLKALDGDMLEIDGVNPDRSVLFGAQTPQVFLSETLKAAYGQPYNVSYTDDASVVRSYGVNVEYVPGEKYNIKITTPEDLFLARALLSAV